MGRWVDRWAGRWVGRWVGRERHETWEDYHTRFASGPESLHALPTNKQFLPSVPAAHMKDSLDVANYRVSKSNYE